MKVSPLLWCACVFSAGASLFAPNFGCSANDTSSRPKSSNGTGGSPSKGSGGTGTIGTGATGGTTTLTVPDSGVETPPTIDGPVGPRLPRPAFPEAPILGEGAPDDAATLFGDPASGASSGGPCLSDPAPDALYPGNWLRPRFTFSASNGQNLFELRLHTAEEPNDLVVYTSNTWWTMPLDMWQKLTNSNNLQSVEITIRGARLSGNSLGNVALGSKQTFKIAPMGADAGGTVVYWTTSGEQDPSAGPFGGGQGALKGFKVADENTLTIIQPSTLKDTDEPVQCVGCHDSTPDGKFTGVSTLGSFGNAVASVEDGTQGAPPSFMKAGGRKASWRENQGPLAFSAAHWSDGDHIQVTASGLGTERQLIWILLDAVEDKEGKSYGTIERQGDPRGVWAMTWSHDGKNIVYTSADIDSVIASDTVEADLYTVPYNDRAGGNAVALSGAAEKDFAEYSPNFSADDKFVVFNRYRVDDVSTLYNQPLSEIYVIPAQGGEAQRLMANDAAACTNKTSPGLTNSWARWSPQVKTVGERAFYWLIFSSVRGEADSDFDMAPAQLYMSGITVVNGKVETHGAVHIWNQPEKESNHQPAWNVFNIPKVPQPENPPR